MKVTFSRDFDFSPPAFKGAVTVAYKAGQTYTLPRDHADAAIAAGAGELVVEQAAAPAVQKTPRRPRRKARA